MNNLSLSTLAAGMADRSPVPIVFEDATPQVEAFVRRVLVAEMAADLLRENTDPGEAVVSGVLAQNRWSPSMVAMLRDDAVAQARRIVREEAGASGRTEDAA
ncbi:MAG: hypothetical protein P0Y66_22015 [Candidatus Kaistia colombiensis]|nr:MAG: hypothetical protein P0Y66_22015 [Kaistia sp.]